MSASDAFWQWIKHVLPDLWPQRVEVELEYRPAGEEVEGRRSLVEGVVEVVEVVEGAWCGWKAFPALIQVLS